MIRSSHRQRTRDDSRARLRQYLLDHPCVDCQEIDLLVLQCDHIAARGTKKNGVSQLVKEGYSWAVVEAELQKCEVRCANCHVRVTHGRRQLARIAMLGKRKC